MNATVYQKPADCHNIFQLNIYFCCLRQRDKNLASGYVGNDVGVGEGQAGRQTVRHTDTLKERQTIYLVVMLMTM